MKRFLTATVLALAFGQCSASAEDADLKQAITKLTEHTIRLEEQNKATQDQLSMLERQIDKRLTMMQDYMDKRLTTMQDYMDKRFEAVDKRLEAVDKRLDLMLWVFGIMGSLLTVGVGYLIYAVRSLAAFEERLKHKVDTERVVKLEKTVKAIVEELEKEGKKIIVDR